MQSRFTFCKVGANYPSSPFLPSDFFSSQGRRFPPLPPEHRPLFASSHFTHPPRPEERGSVAPPGPHLPLTVWLIRPLSFKLNRPSTVLPSDCIQTHPYPACFWVGTQACDVQKRTCGAVCNGSLTLPHVKNVCFFCVCAPLQESKHIVVVTAHIK